MSAGEEHDFQEIMFYNWDMDSLAYMDKQVMHPSYPDGKDPTPRDLPNMYTQEMKARQEDDEGHA